MPPVPPPPLPTPLASTSPTAAEALRVCFLRAAFNASARHRALRYQGPAARLGRVCHQLLECATRGEFDGLEGEALRAAFDQRWVTLIATQAAEVRAAPLEQHLARPEGWPYYQLKRVYTYRAVCQLVTARSHRPALASAPAGGGPSPSERSYVGFGGWLRGRVDQVDVRNGETVLVDYKTGSIFEEGEGAAPQVRAGYRRQLLLYCALHWDETGVWPARGELVSLAGERAVIEVDPAEALGLVEDTLHLLAQYNAQVAGGAVPAARPSAAACAACPYQGMCVPVWDAIDPSWVNGRQATMAGSVVTIADHGSRGLGVDLAEVAGDQPPGVYRLLPVTETRFAGCTVLREGCKVRLVDAQFTCQEGNHELQPVDRTELWWELDGDGS